MIAIDIFDFVFLALAMVVILEVCMAEIHLHIDKGPPDPSLCSYMNWN